jgi:hypothetical protein
MLPDKLELVSVVTAAQSGRSNQLEMGGKREKVTLLN